MKIDIVADKNLACIKVAELIHQQIIKKPSSTIGLATGNTMTGVYNAFKVLVEKHQTDLAQVNFVMLDEYWDIDISHPASFKSYLLNAFAGIKVETHQFHFHKVELPPDEACAYYNNKIQELGGIDLQLLGIGVNGHIAFNEPGTSFEGTTHVIKLTESTIKANEKDFKGAFPTMAITMGIKNIMDAASIIMLALGETKAEVMKRALEGEVSEDCPASILQRHPCLEVVLDNEAAQLIELRSEV
ncbi:MAG: glucosamine-6-phosphate deaminase [Bacteriovoracaceae bacterium]